MRTLKLAPKLRFRLSLNQAGHACGNYYIGAFLPMRFLVLIVLAGIEIRDEA